MKLVGLLLVLLLGFVTLIIGIHVQREWLRRKRTWLYGVGTIVGFEEDNDGCYFPKVRYFINDEEEYFVAENPISYRKKIGSKIKIIFNPNSPEVGMHCTFYNEFRGVVHILFALPLLFIGFLMLAIELA